MVNRNTRQTAQYHLKQTPETQEMSAWWTLVSGEHSKLGKGSYCNQKSTKAAKSATRINMCLPLHCWKHPAFKGFPLGPCFPFFHKQIGPQEKLQMKAMVPFVDSHTMKEDGRIWTGQLTTAAGKAAELSKSWTDPLSHLQCAVFAAADKESTIWWPADLENRSNMTIEACHKVAIHPIPQLHRLVKWGTDDPSPIWGELHLAGL